MSPRPGGMTLPSGGSTSERPVCGGRTWTVFPKGRPALLLALLIFFVGSGWSRAAAFYDTILLGGLWDLSGPYARLGKAYFRGARQAVDYINDGGGVLYTPAELVAGDTKGKGVYLISRAVRLIEKEGVVALLGPSREELVQQLKGVAELHKVPLVLTAGVMPLLRRERWERSWSFGCYMDLRTWSRAVFRELRRSGVRRLGLLVPREEPWSSAGLWLRGYAVEQLFKIHVERYGIADADVVYQLEQMERDGDRAVVVLGPRGAGARLAASFRGSSMAMVVTPGVVSDRLLATASVAGTEVIAALPPLVLGDSVPPTHPCASAVMAFQRAMGGELRSMSIEERMAAGRGWDSVFMLLKAVREAGAPTRERVRNALEYPRSPYYGVSGIFSPNRSSHTHQISRWLLVRAWRNGKWQSLQPKRGTR